MRLSHRGAPDDPMWRGEALGSRISEVKIAQYGTGEQPFAQLPGGIKAILDLVESTKSRA
jgi:hypothetical protein